MDNGRDPPLATGRGKEWRILQKNQRTISPVHDLRRTIAHEADNTTACF
jgi:hypothetical protein